MSEALAVTAAVIIVGGLVLAVGWDSIRDLWRRR